MKLTLTVMLLLGFTLHAAHTDDLQAQTGSSLPSKATERAIRDLPARNKMQPSTAKTKVRKYDAGRSNFRQFSVPAAKIPNASKDKFQLNAKGQAEVPFVAPNSIILKFEPEVSKEEMTKFLDERKLEVVRTYPTIGAIQVEGDLSAYFTPKLSDNNANDTVLRGLTNVIKEFQADPRIRSATPDTVLRDQSTHNLTDIQITNLLTPSDVVLSNANGSTETTDWGIGNIEADQLWSLPGAQDGALFGVMDVGFARHEDLVFIELSPDTDIDDHGNHVAAIACARHDNNVGVKGVLPNCMVRARSGDVFMKSDEGGQVLEFFFLFSQVLATLESFVDSQDDVHTFNISLGYNWRSNFGINPDLPESAQWRTLVASQGAFLVPLLEAASKNGRVIFSAAGNDSSGLATPINAKYASPFNWAAVTVREQGIAKNGIIVEAHHPNGNRAGFSNTGGHISCPGVNVLSAVVFDSQGNIVRNAYGKMSGTSMASPYCASAHLLFKLVRPGYDGVEAIDCLTQSSDTSSSGTPMLRLSQALSVCPPKPS
ncbi:MAG: S8 family serine peptidase [Hyphomicrobiaceae bacterium]|nr:S8 family serine peptidase [Hyphomicrobiaceae bacterium]